VLGQFLDCFRVFCSMNAAHNSRLIRNCFVFGIEFYRLGLNC
jgi:hypothetical protein